jgi:hypothetical protein
VGVEGVARRFGLLESEINWAPSAELSLGAEKLMPVSAMVDNSFSKSNI